MFRKIKGIFCLLLTIVIALSLSGCAKKEINTEIEENKTITVYATFYPLYAFTEMIAQDIEGVRVRCLVQPQDGCLRNYELSDWDLALLLRSASAVIAGGRGMESFEGTLFAMGENGPTVSAVLYNMELDQTSAEGVPEGEEAHWDGENPHIYMSVDGAIELIERISATMQTLDPEYSEAYYENQTAATQRLNALKAEMQQICADVCGARVAILNEALWYFAKNFDLDAALCYHRESGEDIDNMDTLLECLDESGAKIILIEKQAPYALTEALSDAGFAVAKLDILSTRRADEGAKGYFDAQIGNAEALSAAYQAATNADITQSTEE